MKKRQVERKRCQGFVEAHKERRCFTSESVLRLVRPDWESDSVDIPNLCKIFSSLSPSRLVRGGNRGER